MGEMQEEKQEKTTGISPPPHRQPKSAGSPGAIPGPRPASRGRPQLSLQRRNRQVRPRPNTSPEKLSGFFLPPNHDSWPDWTTDVRTNPGVSAAAPRRPLAESPAPAPPASSRAWPDLRVRVEERLSDKPLRGGAAQVVVVGVERLRWRANPPGAHRLPYSRGRSPPGRSSSSGGVNGSRAGAPVATAGCSGPKPVRYAAITLPAAAGCPEPFTE